MIWNGTLERSPAMAKLPKAWGAMKRGSTSLPDWKLIAVTNCETRFQLTMSANIGQSFRVKRSRMGASQ
ncbi:hypothetical protein LMIY3S_00558 [Labrys miyagiensis]